MIIAIVNEYSDEYREKFPDQTPDSLTDQEFLEASLGRYENIEDFQEAFNKGNIESYDFIRFITNTIEKKDEQIMMFCDICGGALQSHHEFVQQENGGFVHAHCMLEESEKGLDSMSLHDLTTVLNQADGFRLTQFFISYIKEGKYIASTSMDSHIFSISVMRQEVVDAVVKKTQE